MVMSSDRGKGVWRVAADEQVSPRGVTQLRCIPLIASAQKSCSIRRADKSVPHVSARERSMALAGDVVCSHFPASLPVCSLLFIPYASFSSFHNTFSPHSAAHTTASFRHVPSCLIIFYFGSGKTSNSTNELSASAACRFSDAGPCICKPPWTGHNCSVSRCRNSCSGNGVCTNSGCSCYPGYLGDACETTTCR